jgi:hypothetical protein
MRLPQVLNAMALLSGLLALVLNFELSSSPFNRFYAVRRQARHPVVLERRNCRTQLPPAFRSAHRPLAYTLGTVGQTNSLSPLPDVVHELVVGNPRTMYA